MGHAIVLATLPGVRKLGHRLFVRSSRLRFRRRSAGMGEESQPLGGQTGSKLIGSRNNHGVHGQGAKIIQGQLGLIRGHRVKAYGLRRISCRSVDNLPAQLILIEAVQSGQVYGVSGNPISQLFRRCPTHSHTCLADIFDRHIGRRTGYQLHTLQDALQTTESVLDAGHAGLQLVREGSVLAAAHVLAKVRNLLVHAAGHMVAAIRHAAHNAGEVPLAGLRIDARGAIEDVVHIAESHALRGHIGPLAALGKVMGHQRWHLAGPPKAAIILRVQRRRQQEHITRLRGRRVRGISRSTRRRMQLLDCQGLRREIKLADRKIKGQSNIKSS